MLPIVRELNINPQELQRIKSLGLEILYDFLSESNLKLKEWERSKAREPLAF